MEVIIGGADVALVIVVAVVGGRGYGDVYYLDGISFLARRLICEGGGKVGRICEDRFQCQGGVNGTFERSKDYVAYNETRDVVQGVERERTAVADEKYRGNQSVDSKQLQQYRKVEQRVCAQGLVEIKGCDN